MWQALPAPKDDRPITAPDTLGGQPRTSDPTASRQADDIQQTAATQWWPGRPVAVAYYDGTLPYRPNPVVSEATWRGGSGAHLMVLRGRFGQKYGDAHAIERVDRLLGQQTKPPTVRIGPTTCETTLLTVCWRESDRLSVSVLHMERLDPDLVAVEVDEAWSAAR